MDISDFYNLLNRHNIPFGKQIKAREHTHIVEIQKDVHCRLKLTKEYQFRDIYNFAKNNPIKIMCNPGYNMDRRPYLDIDCDKEFCLSDADIQTIISSFSDICYELFGFADTIKMIKSTDSNVHLVYDVRLSKTEEIEPYIFQKLVIKAMKAKNPELSDQIDDSVGIRALYAPKLNKLDDFYRLEVEGDYIDDCLLTDPSYIEESLPAEISEDTIIKALLLKSNLDKRRHQYVSRGEHNPIEIPVKDVITKIKKIPNAKFHNYYSWKIVLASILETTTDDETRNKQILAAFDYKSRCSNKYDEIKNKKIYKDSPVLVGGWEKLAQVQEKTVKLSDLIKTTGPQVHTFKNAIYEDKQYIGEFPAFDNDLYIRSATGTGKSVALRKFICNNPTKRFLIIGQRILLLKSMLTYLSNAGIKFDFYQDSDWEKNGNLVIQMESIAKIRDIQHYDYIICDEFVSILAQFSSPNYVRPLNAIHNFCKLFNSNAKLIAMDGYLEQHWIDMFISKFQNRMDYKVFVNTRQNKKHEEVILFDDNEQFFQNLQLSLDENKKIVFAADTKKIAKMVYEMFKSRDTDTSKTLLIDGDNSKKAEILNICQNINEEIIKYDRFVYSPSIESGFSIDVPHFDVQFSYFNYSDVSLVSNLQMMNRARIKNDNLNLVYINKYETYKSREQIIYDFKTRACDLSENSLIKTCIAPDVNMNVFIDTNPIIKMIVDFKIQKSKYGAQFNKYLISMLKTQGYNVQYWDLLLPVNERIIIKNDLKRLRVGARKTNAIEVVNDEHRFDQKKAILKVYDLKEITPEFVEKHGDWKQLGTFSRRLAMLKNINFDYASDIIETDKDSNYKLSQIMNNKYLDTHKTIAKNILQTVCGMNFKMIMSREDFIIKAKSIQFPEWKRVVSLFNIRGKSANSASWEVVCDNYRSMLAFMNTITGQVFGITIKHHQRTMIKFQINDYDHPRMDELINSDVFELEFDDSGEIC